MAVTKHSKPPCLRKCKTLEEQLQVDAYVPGIEWLGLGNPVPVDFRTSHVDPKVNGFCWLNGGQLGAYKTTCRESCATSRLVGSHCSSCKFTRMLVLLMHLLPNRFGAPALSITYYRLKGPASPRPGPFEASLCFQFGLQRHCFTDVLTFIALVSSTFSVEVAENPTRSGCNIGKVIMPRARNPRGAQSWRWVN